MPTTGVLNSTLFNIYTGTTPSKVAHCTGVSISLSHEPRETTTKDSGGWSEKLEGLRSWEGSGEGLVAFDDVNGGLALTNSLLNRTPLTVVFTTNQTGDKKYTGQGYVTSLEISSPESEDNVTYSFSITGTGALIEATV
jgi:TP901-1 family phage major tail protein